MRPGLLVHCYRMLGSAHEAEDAVQETLLRAWRGRPVRGARLRAVLALLRRHQRLPPRDRAARAATGPVDLGPARPGRRARPGAARDGVARAAAGRRPDLGLHPAEAVYEQREAVELAFIAALQHLPALQRAVLVLRDVLAFSAAGPGGDPGDDRAVGDQRAGAGPRVGQGRAPRAQPTEGPARGGRPPGARHRHGVRGGVGAQRRGRRGRPACRGRRDDDAALRRVVPRSGRGRCFPGRGADGRPPSLAGRGHDGQRPARRGLQPLGRGDRRLPQPRVVAAQLRAGCITAFTTFLEPWVVRT